MSWVEIIWAIDNKNLDSYSSMQVGSYRDSNEADVAMQFLIKKGYIVHIDKVDGWYRVIIDKGISLVTPEDQVNGSKIFDQQTPNNNRLHTNKTFTPLDNSTTQPSFPNEKSLAFKFSVQVGAFKKIENVKNLRNKLINEGYQSYIVRRSRLYCLRVGESESLSKAVTIAQDLSKKLGRKLIIYQGADSSQILQAVNIPKDNFIVSNKNSDKSDIVQDKSIQKRFAKNEVKVDNIQTLDITEDNFIVSNKNSDKSDIVQNKSTQKRFAKNELKVDNRHRDYISMDISGEIFYQNIPLPFTKQSINSSTTQRSFPNNKKNAPPISKINIKENKNLTSTLFFNNEKQGTKKQEPKTKKQKQVFLDEKDDDPPISKIDIKENENLTSTLIFNNEKREMKNHEPKIKNQEQGFSDEKHIDLVNYSVPSFENLKKKMKIKNNITLDESVVQAKRRYNEGVQYMKKEELTKAIEKFDEAISLYPLFIQAHNNLGIVYQRLGKNNEAVLAYQRALQIDPYYSNSLSNIGIIFLTQGDYEKAAMIFKVHLSHSPYDPELRLNLGIALQRQRHFHDAISEFKKILEVHPDNYLALYNLGLTLDQAGQKEEAQYIFKRFVSNAPKEFAKLKNRITLITDIK
ncbi:MAG: tetratricopeptide repeat protein [bacterium]